MDNTAEFAATADKSGFSQNCFRARMPTERQRAFATAKRGERMILCGGKRKTRRNAEKRRCRDANEKIEFAFGPGAEERFGIAMPIMNAHARGHLHDLVARIYDEQIESITLSADGIKATMRKTSKGYIRIQRKDAQEIALEVIT